MVKISYKYFWMYVLAMSSFACYGSGDGTRLSFMFEQEHEQELLNFDNSKLLYDIVLFKSTIEVDGNIEVLFPAPSKNDEGGRSNSVDDKKIFEDRIWQALIKSKKIKNLEKKLSWYQTIARKKKNFVVGYKNNRVITEGYLKDIKQVEKVRLTVEVVRKDIFSIIFDVLKAGGMLAFLGWIIYEFLFAEEEYEDEELDSLFR